MSIEFMVSYFNPDCLVVRTLSCNRCNPGSKPDLERLRLLFTFFEEEAHKDDGKNNRRFSVPENNSKKAVKFSARKKL